MNSRASVRLGAIFAGSVLLVSLLLVWFGADTTPIGRDFGRVDNLGDEPGRTLFESTVDSGSAERTNVAESKPRIEAEALLVRSSNADEPPCPWITARLVDIDGIEMANDQFAVQTVHETEDDRITDADLLYVDTEGRIRIKLPRPYRAGDQRVIRIIAGRGEATKAPQVSLDLSHWLPPGETDLGDVRLNARLIVSGEILDHRGALLPRCHLVLLPPQDATEPSDWSWWWRTGENGKFAIYGDVEMTGRVGVEARRTSSRTDAIEVLVGSRNIAFQLSAN